MIIDFLIIYLNLTIIPLYVSNYFSTLLNEKLYVAESVSAPGASSSYANYMKFVL